MRARHRFAVGSLMAVLAACSVPADPAVTAGADPAAHEPATLELALTAALDATQPVASEIEAPRPVEPPRAPRPRPPEVVVRETEPAANGAGADGLDDASSLNVPATVVSTVSGAAPVAVPLTPRAAEPAVATADGNGGGKGVTSGGGGRAPAPLPGVIIRGGRGEGIIDPCAIHVPRPAGGALINERVPRGGLPATAGGPQRLPGGVMRGGIR